MECQLQQSYHENVGMDVTIQQVFVRQCGMDSPSSSILTGYTCVTNVSLWLYPSNHNTVIQIIGANYEKFNRECAMKRFSGVALHGKSIRNPSTVNSDSRHPGLFLTLHPVSMAFG